MASTWLTRIRPFRCGMTAPRWLMRWSLSALAFMTRWTGPCASCYRATLAFQAPEKCANPEPDGISATSVETSSNDARLTPIVEEMPSPGAYSCVYYSEQAIPPSWPSEKLNLAFVAFHLSGKNLDTSGDFRFETIFPIPVRGGNCPADSSHLRSNDRCPGSASLLAAATARRQPAATTAADLSRAN